MLPAHWFLPGDSALFKRGQVYVGSMTIWASGTTGQPLLIGAYGEGSKPIITGFTIVSDWSQLRSGIYQATSSSYPARLNVVVVDDVMQGMGRMPKLSASNGGYWKIDSHSGNTAIDSANLDGQQSFVGGELVMRKIQWIMDRFSIDSQS